jgi:hypothetical protein
MTSRPLHKHRLSAFDWVSYQSQIQIALHRVFTLRENTLLL